MSTADFLASIENEERRADAKQLITLFKKATGMKPTFWNNNMVGFGTYHYKSERSTQEGDWPLTAFSPRSANITIYIMPGFKAYAALLKKIGKHKISGGSCLYVRKVSDMHLPTLTLLIQKSVHEMQKRYGKK